MKSNKIILSLLVILIVFNVLQNYWWIYNDGKGPITDEISFYFKSINIFNIINNPSPNIIKRIMMADPVFRPPIFPLLITPFYFLFDISYETACLSLNLFLALAIIYTYKIGKSLSNGKAGIIGAYLMSSTPFVIRYSKQLYSEVFLLAVFAMALYSLINTNNFQNRRFSLCFGIIMGVGLLTKQIFILFIIFPLLFEITKFIIRKTGVLKKNDGKDVHNFKLAQCFFKKSKYNIIIAIATASLIAASYLYIPRNQMEFYNKMASVTGLWNIRHNLSSIGTFLSYITVLQRILGLSVFCIFIAGLIGISIKPKNNLLLLASFWGSFITLSILLKDRERYLSTILPVIVTIIGIWVSRIRIKLLENGIISVIILSGIFNYVWMWDALKSINISAYHYPIKSAFFNSHFDILPNPLIRTKKDDWMVSKIFNDINQDSQTKDYNILVVPLLTNFHSGNFQALALIDEIELTIWQPSWKVFGINYWTLKHSDYIVTKTGRVRDLYGPRCFRKEVADFLDNPPPLWSKHHQILRKYALPDESLAIVYKRISPVTIEEKRQILNRVIEIDEENIRAVNEYQKLQSLLNNR